MPHIDTHSFVKRITAAGMAEPQAEIIAEALAVHGKHVSKPAIVESVEKLGRGIDKQISALKDGQAKLQGDVSELRAGQAELKSDVAELKAGQSQIMGLLTKILDGQAVITQNEMELGPN